MDVYQLAIDNDRFRKVLVKEDYIKITVMNLIGRGVTRKYDDDNYEIPWEEHKGAQVIQVCRGAVVVKIKGQSDKLLYAGKIAVIPPHTQHYVINNQYTDPAKLLSIYTPAGEMEY